MDGEEFTDAGIILAGMAHHHREFEAGIEALRNNAVIAEECIVAFECASEQIELLLSEGQ